MKPHDPSFLTFEGDSVTGRVPVAFRVFGNGGVLTPAQQAGVANAYRRFRDAVKLGTGGFLVQNRVLDDGSKVRMLSVLDRDTVMVTVAGGGPGGWALHPAFWYNAPGVADPIPTDIESGTWLNLPYKGDPLESRQRFWQAHPGSRTWRNSRADSKTRGLVLSWWGLNNDNYSANWIRPTTAPAFPYHKLYCNGTLIAEFDDTKAIMGACICLVDDVAKITVAMSPVETKTVSSQDVKQYASAALGELIAEGTGPANVESALTITFMQATLPAAFMDGKIGRIAFSELNTVIVATAVDGDVFQHDGVDYTFFNDGALPFVAVGAGIRFNSSGTEGVLNMSGTAFTYPDPDDGNFLAWGLLFDPRTGTILDAVTTEIADGSADIDRGGELEAIYGDPCTVLQFALCYAMDYIDGTGEDPDRLVWVTYRRATIDDGIPSTADFLYHSEHGVLLHDTVGGPLAVADWRWIVSGDLRGDIVHFTGINSPDLQVLTWLRGVRLDDVDDTAPVGLVPQLMVAQTGYEGCDTSFDDNRMVVDRTYGQEKVYVDGEDVTATVDDDRLPDAKFPVLCGPFRFPLGAEPARPAIYVAGDPP